MAETRLAGSQGAVAGSGGGLEEFVDKDEGEGSLLVAVQVVLDGGDHPVDARAGLGVLLGETEGGGKLGLVDAVDRLAAGDVDRLDRHGVRPRSWSRSRRPCWRWGCGSGSRG